MNLALDIKPIVEAVLAAVIDRFGDAARVCYPEAEAAGLLGVNRHVLRDARLRGEIIGSKIGRGWGYTRGDLVAWVASRRDRGAAE